MLDKEHALWSAGYEAIAGLDEAGRGCLAGPVVAAAVILPHDVDLPMVADSKTLSAKKRLAAREAIEVQAQAVAVGICSPQEIDRLNILYASLHAMRRAANDCQPRPDYLLIDGNKAFDDAPCPHETVVKGDATSLSIAAASIIAKTERDAMMHALHEEHPEYGWDTNVGYPTRAHYAALDAHGPTPYHRTSFKLSRT
ncbi:ribonuclease HII [Longimonas halophila]|uniref:Ribonuclease HII n=1 Tax=Longimonas halophila TaxID=1469170 RepID=A0A2H3NI04_9BACT|nr:ribonuclease HII [Longimonas halophila]PEN04947.1 ribonuclease HII [Longimonas halophila]